MQPPSPSSPFRLGPCASPPDHFSALYLSRIARASPAGARLVPQITAPRLYPGIACFSSLPTAYMQSCVHYGVCGACALLFRCTVPGSMRSGGGGARAFLAQRTPRTHAPGRARARPAVRVTIAVCQEITPNEGVYNADAGAAPEELQEGTARCAEAAHLRRNCQIALPVAIKYVPLLLCSTMSAKLRKKASSIRSQHAIYTLLRKLESSL